MITAIDVAEYILKKTGPITAMKLQKLVYYAQAWHLAWTENVLFEDKIEAWKNGPVMSSLFNHHKGCLKLYSGFFTDKIKPREILPLNNDQQDVVNRVIHFYGSKDPHWLSQLTHMEDPWKIARSKSTFSDEERSTEEITPLSMLEYYTSL